MRGIPACDQDDAAADSLARGRGSDRSWPITASCLARPMSIAKRFGMDPQSSTPGPTSALQLAREGGRAKDVTTMGARIWGLSKRAANYRPAPKPEVRCEACKYMFPRLALGGCRLVRGVIQGSATCDEFTPR